MYIYIYMYICIYIYLYTFFSNSESVGFKSPGPGTNARPAKPEQSWNLAETFCCRVAKLGQFMYISPMRVSYLIHACFQHVQCVGRTVFLAEFSETPTAADELRGCEGELGPSRVSPQGQRLPTLVLLLSGHWAWSINTWQQESMIRHCGDL